MFIPVLLLAPIGVSLQFSLTHIVPGFASGLLVGSAGLAFLGVRLSKRENRQDVTAQVYGNNVPAILAYTLSIFLPVYLETHDAERAWEIGAAAVVWTGIIKLVAAPFAGAFRRYIPVPASMTVFGAAMYSYLALILLQRVFDQPLVGIAALMIVCVAVFAGVPITRYKLPPFLVAWLVPLALGVAGRLRASGVVRLIVRAAVRADRRAVARDGAGGAVSFGDRSHFHLPRAAGYCVS